MGLPKQGGKIFSPYFGNTVAVNVKKKKKKRQRDCRNGGKFFSPYFRRFCRNKYNKYISAGIAVITYNCIAGIAQIFFFFLHLRQCYFHFFFPYFGNAIVSSSFVTFIFLIISTMILPQFFFPISAMPLPQLVVTNFFN